MFICFIVALTFALLRPLNAFDMEGLIDGKLIAASTDGNAGLFNDTPLPEAQSVPCGSPDDLVRLRHHVFCNVLQADPDLTETAGKGIIRFRILVEAGLGHLKDGFVGGVGEILGDGQGWARGGIRFEHVANQHEFTILLAKPRSVDLLCRPLRTGGILSCAARGNAIINADRWLLGARTWPDDISGYRHYLIKHEVGHILGLGHTKCPSKGALAPIMLPQTKSLEGCTANGNLTPRDLSMFARLRPRLKRRLQGPGVNRLQSRPRRKIVRRKWRRKYKRRRCRRGCRRKVY